jgi:hypothetical protein
MLWSEAKELVGDRSQLTSVQLLSHIAAPRMMIEAEEYPSSIVLRSLPI